MEGGLVEAAAYSKPAPIANRSLRQNTITVSLTETITIFFHRQAKNL